MKLTLKVTGGPAAGHQMQIDAGRTIRIGRSSQADFAVAEDVEMSGLHFSVSCENGTCTVRDLQSTNGTYLNEQRIDDGVFGEGDQLRAGRSFFAVTASARLAEQTHVHAATPVAETRAETVAVDSDGFVTQTASEIATRCQFQDGAEDYLREDQSPRQFLELLSQHGLFGDAVRFLAFALHKRKAIGWACRCARLAGENEFSETEAAALGAAEKWVNDPSEENRRAAMVAAQADETRTASAWAAVGAFWSGGSMAPPEAPVVPPGEDFSGKAVGGAVQLAAVSRHPERVSETLETFFQLGMSMAAEESEV